MQFRELTKKSKQLPNDDCIQILQSEKRGVLAVNGDNGFPYAIPMNHYYDPDDGCIYFHCGKQNGHRSDALAHSDKVSFCVTAQGEQSPDGWAFWMRSVIVFGQMEIIDDPAEITRIAAALSRKFTQDEVYIENEIARYAKATLLLKLVPAHICGKLVLEA